MVSDERRSGDPRQLSGQFNLIDETRIGVFWAADLLGWMSVKMEVLGNYLDSFKLIDEARMGVFWAADPAGLEIH